MAASDRRGAPRWHGHADVGADVATVDRVHGSLWTEPVPSNLDHPREIQWHRVSAGQQVTGEEGHAGGTMVGVNWNRRYGVPGHQNVNGGYGRDRQLTVSRMGAFSAFGTAPEVRLTAMGL